MNDMATNGPTQNIDITGMSTEQLRGELARVLKVSAADLIYLANIWGELERRGEDLSDLRRGMGTYLPMIASGKLDAEAVVRFAGHKTMLSAIAELPLAEQRRLAGGGTVKLVVFDERNGWSDREVPPDALTTAQVRQVFGGSRLLSTEDQYAMLAKQGKKLLAKRSQAKSITVDRRGGVLKIGDERVPIDKVLAVLRTAGLISGASS